MSQFFPHSKDFNISGGNFSNVGRDQYHTSYRTTNHISDSFNNNVTTNYGSYNQTHYHKNSETKTGRQTNGSPEEQRQMWENFARSMWAQAQARIGSTPGSSHAPRPRSRAPSSAPPPTKEVSHREQAQATSATASHNNHHPTTTRITNDVHSIPTTKRQLEPASCSQRPDPSGTEGDDKLAHVSAPPASISASPSPPQNERVARVLDGSAAGAVLMEVQAGVVATPDDHHTTPKHEMRESLSMLTPAPDITTPIRNETCQEVQDKAASSSRIGTQSPKTLSPLSTNTLSHATTALEGSRSPDMYHARARPPAAGDDEKEVQGSLPGTLTSTPVSPSYSKGCAENRSEADATALDASQDLPTRRADMEKVLRVIRYGGKCWLPLSMAELARLVISGMLGFALITYAYYYS